MSALVLCVAAVFCDPPTAPVEFDSVVKVLPPCPVRRCGADDPRTTAWLFAYSLALRIDCRGYELAKPDIDQAVAHRLRLLNLADARSLFRALELIREWDAERQPLYVRR